MRLICESIILEALGCSVLHSSSLKYNSDIHRKRGIRKKSKHSPHVIWDTNPFVSTPLHNN
jgi:hypothetical protein